MHYGRASDGRLDFPDRAESTGRFRCSFSVYFHGRWKKKKTKLTLKLEVVIVVRASKKQTEKWMRITVNHIISDFPGSAAKNNESS